jgi:hypothetical protein
MIVEILFDVKSNDDCYPALKSVGKLAVLGVSPGRA